MVFKFHTAFAVGLIAMVAGMYLITRVRAEGMCCRGLAKVVGWVVLIAAFLCVLCTGYYSFSYWRAGYYCPSKMGRPADMMMMGRVRKGRGMRTNWRKMMRDCPHMQEAMKKCPHIHHRMMMEDEGPEEYDD